MIIKKSSILFAAVVTAFVFITSCEDGKKKEEQMRIETERVEMEAAEKAKMEQEAEKAKEAKIKEEARANSVAGQAMMNEDLTTLAGALQAADLSTMLSEPGEYTVFAPSNHAFEKLSQKKRDELMLPENKEMLSEVLTYHVVPGVINSEKFAAAIKGADGSYTFKTVTGEELTASMNGDQFVIKDGSGKKAQVILGNVPASNGIIYIIDTVLMAKK
ncbi:fasciclin domain-containing protein [Gelidibacter maritimus]|uniref:Fasciclin domain-containing protein n=1 Tax=Gelidibacter maritimus TaxID=2761487 RepID=A0A7W2M6B7_9FLAO|nr:fasciclin domain-containing protein [Gelidibacter maritimus]MBA6153497.1 fasciclin domain-containing protein [Gelidibacter maritimus]